MGTQDEGGEEGDTIVRQLVSSSSSAAAFVQSGFQDACEDSCSICLEPFCHSDPATVTSCKHEYHVQCILEWAQRSKECPMCWQLLSLEDPLSQELLEAEEQEQAWRHLEDDAQIQEASGFASYNDIEERIMQHLAQQLAQRSSLQNTRVSDMPIEQPADGSLAATGRRTMPYNHWTSRICQQRADRHQSNVEPVHEGPERLPSLEDSESLKSRFLVASAKCKETFTRTSRSLKERWRGRSNNAEDFRARAQEVSASVVRQALNSRVQEVSASVVRQALNRITSSDGNEDAPTTSTGLTSMGKQGTNRCNESDHLEGVASRDALSQQSTRAV